jgi:redox-sensitive bicupin YhaK (pirin superfamily)
MYGQFMGQVTYVLEGGWHHKDSNGNEGHLGPGWVQWMTAGSGVIHRCVGTAFR